MNERRGSPFRQSCPRDKREARIDELIEHGHQTIPLESNILFLNRPFFCSFCNFFDTKQLYGYPNSVKAYFLAFMRGEKSPIP
jgi:hypothetical protein